MFEIVVLFLCWCFGLCLLWRIPAFNLPAADMAEWPRLSVIIPARNEEGRLGPLLDSLRRQRRPAHEVLVVDDDSSDATAALAASGGARVLRGEALPVGWAGKPWACWQGAQHASGDLLVFLDADTWLEPDGLERLVQGYLAQGGLLSVQPFHRVRRLYEELSAFFNIVQMAGMNAFTPLGDRLAPGGAFGPCILCRRDDYLRTGGHGAENVRSQVLEDISLARLFARQGLPVHCRGGWGAISFRMYPGGPGQLIEGWSKNMGSGLVSIRPAFALLASAWITGCFASWAGLLRNWSWPPTLQLGLVGLFYLLYALEVGWMLGRIGTFRPWTALFFPLPLTFFALVMLRSLVLSHLLGRVTWRGRQIQTVQSKEEPGAGAQQGGKKGNPEQL